MAQPLFNEHPLQDYLRQSGDNFEPIPGAMSDLTDPFSEECAETDTDADLRLWSWLPTPVLLLVQFFNIIVTSAQNHHSTLREFSDKFQYDVISSPLLSSSVTAPSSTRRRSSSSTGDAPPDDPDLKTRTESSPPIPSHSVEHRTSAWSLTLFCLCCISLFFDSFILCVLMGTALYYIESYTVQPGNLPDFITPTLGSLNDLIVAANLWDSAVHEAINLLELEESMSPTLSLSSPLRVALHSSLQSTQVQSDNVRHVLVGLTAPSALAQLSEMYAPPSPTKPLAPLHSRSGSATAGSRMRASTPLSSDKRATWNGSMSYNYAALANAGTPSRRSLMRWEKRRSDLSALLLRPTGAAMSAPTTPEPGKSLNGVEEERRNDPAAANTSDQEGDADAVVPLSERGQFASAALEFQRQRRSRGVESLFLSTPSPSPKYTAISPQPPTSTHITRLGNRSHSSQSPPPSSYSTSRFTAMQMPRHPLSLYSLTLTLNGALAARRYAASHLLALRFVGGDALEDSGRGGDSYWEDVRAVMALLTSALANATAPLVEALEAAEHERLLTENPTPTTAHSRASSESHTRSASFHQQRLARRTSHVTSFAPLPSHLSRFAAHVDALTNALHDAREHLESCVASLRDGTASGSSSPQDTPALRAYERLRRELGLALRECERGREPLLELLLPPRALSPDDEDDEEVPALGPDAESSDSDKDASASSRAAHSPISSLPSSPTHAVLVEARPGREEEEGGTDAAKHERGDVLVVGLERLPAPGIEQVFEAGAGADPAGGDADGDGAFSLTRPRSKLSRAERIAAAKARRASGGGLGLSVVGGQGDRDGAGGVQWAPVGDVVQELKDVIWKVGEQRRMRELRQKEELDRVPSTEDVFTS
ncbi:hypothetical protein EDB92DRAFT_1831568 [Lactarius akahatsu]|uniref:Uncharacterized protein n=1 Tax=Lactarius akahatsu TaxID=416441 RepID=A0AAD4LQX4_9AGAM|nr:hypothetical protein EDB92DRAFT_1831568 [Lactarius akahatsu]